MPQWLRVLAALAENLGLDFQRPHDSSHLSISPVAPVPGNPTPSFDLRWHQGHNWCIDIQAGKYPNIPF